MSMDNGGELVIDPDVLPCPHAAETRTLVLSDYEAGRAEAAIRAVALLDKPITAETSRVLSSAEAAALLADLDWLISQLAHGMPVRAYVTPRADNRADYGFYVYGWTLDALRVLDREQQALGPHVDWIKGLLFGYRPGAIASFLRGVRESASPDAPEGK